MLVKSSGNASGPGGGEEFCVPINDPNCQGVPLLAEKVDPMGWLARHWSGSNNPILLVEAYNIKDNNQVPLREKYANWGGDITGPGNENLAPAENLGYRDFGGTSAAAPFVAGLAGYLFVWDENLSLDAVRNAIVGRAHDDVGEQPGAPGVPSAPRLDAYASMLGMPDAATALVDVNDPSSDGNRRVVYIGDEEVPDLVQGKAFSRFTAPDGTIDMRDFRRYRDVRLSHCREESTPGCIPAAADGARRRGRSSEVRSQPRRLRARVPTACARRRTRHRGSTSTATASCRSSPPRRCRSRRTAAPRPRARPRT